MAFVYSDRVKEQSSSVGFVAMVLSGAVPGFQTFADGIGDTNQTYYTIVNVDNDWEVGRGTFTLAGTTLSRDTVLASSNSNNPVNFATGTKTVFSSVAAQFFGGVITAVTHASLNHTGILGVPGPESFTSGDHDIVDHTAVPFQLLDTTAHDGIDHKTAPHNLLDEPAHDLLNHAGLSGVNNFDIAAHGLTNHAGLLGINPGQVTSPERTAGSESALRSFSPNDVAVMAGIHGGGGGGKLVQQVRNRSNTLITCTTGTPLYDNTIPQQTEGTEVITVGITPQSTSNILCIEFSAYGAGSQVQLITALYRDAIPNALAVGHNLDLWQLGNRQHAHTYLNYYLTAPSTSPQTYKIRIGGDPGGVWYVNGNEVGAAKFGGVFWATLTVAEIAP